MGEEGKEILIEYRVYKIWEMYYCKLDIVFILGIGVRKWFSI